MKGYKISENGICNGFKYEVGKTYTFKGKLRMDENGFHFCEHIDDVFKCYDYDKNKTIIFEIEAVGKIIRDFDKCVTDKIKILRTIPKKEYNKLFNRHKFDKNSNMIYEEDSDGYWRKWKFDKNNNEIYYENSDGFWRKWKYDKNNNLIYYENLNGFWEKWKYDKNNNKIYYENSNGFWIKWKYDKNNIVIYKENSNGCKFVF